jgi:AcrR family transcriptional regulator
MTHPSRLPQTPAGPDQERGRQEPESRSARKRRAIVEAATALFLRHGYLGTSMDQIALFAAVSKPTVYKFFPDKEQLLTAIVLETLDHAGTPFLDGLARLAGTDQLADDMRQLARRYLATVTQPPVLQLRPGAGAECTCRLLPAARGPGPAARTGSGDGRLPLRIPGAGPRP